MKRRSLAPILALFLSACGGVVSEASPAVCPPWPIAGPSVAAELERVCLPEEHCPATWDWLKRLDLLKRQLDLCRSMDPPA